MLKYYFITQKILKIYLIFINKIQKMSLIFIFIIYFVLALINYIFINYIFINVEYISEDKHLLKIFNIFSSFFFLPLIPILTILFRVFLLKFKTNNYNILVGSFCILLTSIPYYFLIDFYFADDITIISLLLTAIKIINHVNINLILLRYSANNYIVKFFRFMYCFLIYLIPDIFPNYAISTSDIVISFIYYDQIIYLLDNLGSKIKFIFN